MFLRSLILTLLMTAAFSMAAQAAEDSASQQAPALQKAQAGSPSNALNPTFRYEGGTPGSEGRWRSRALPISAMAMTMADLEGNKRPFLVLADGGSIRVLQYRDGDMRDVAQVDLPSRVQVLNLSAADIDNDGREEIICSGWRNEEPYSMILSMKGGKMSVEYEGGRYHLRAVRLPPDFHKVLLGQSKGTQDIFQRGDIRRMNINGGELNAGARILLAGDGDIFNFSYLPTREGLRLVVVGKGEKLYVYNQDGQQQSSTEEAYNGTANGLAVDDAAVPGMGQERKTNRDDFSLFVPMPLVVADLEGKGVFEVLANRNLTLAGRLFAKYRNYTQGEIQAMFWDGVGLQMQWKTERLKGYVVGYDVADLRGDGQKELVVALNTDTGGVGLATGRTIVLAYDLGGAGTPPAHK